MIVSAAHIASSTPCIHNTCHSICTHDTYHSITNDWSLLTGNECPAAVSNFKSLCLNEEEDENGRYGYAGSSIFRVISQFSVQGAKELVAV
jgi:hypothetical protein